MSDNLDDGREGRDEPESFGERVIRPAGGPQQDQASHIDQEFRDEWRQARTEQHETDEQAPVIDPTVNVWKPKAKGWQPAGSTWPNLNATGGGQDVTPRSQNSDGAKGSNAPKKRRWTFRRLLLVLIVVIALALVGWDIGARLSSSGGQANPSGDGGSSASAPKVAPVPAAVKKAAVTFEQLSITKQGTVWCSMTADRKSCLNGAGSHAMYLDTFKTPPKVAASAIVPTDDGSKPTNAAVFVGYHVDGRHQPQEDVFVIRLADHKVVGAVRAISDDQAAQGPAQLGAAILSDPDSVDGALTW